MLTDIYDNPLSTGSPTAQARFNDALREIRTFHGDPIATLDAALEHDPDFGLAWITRAIVLAQITDRMFDTEVQRSLRAASACRLDDRERSHFSAALAWSEGRLHESTMAFARIAADSPRDAMGREAIALEPKDTWAAHAVAHVNEMRGDIAGGRLWLEETSGGWAQDCGFAYHNWWHLGLLCLEAQDHVAAMRLYDERIRPNDAANVVLEMLDATAMLWRLRLESVDTGDRFARLAPVWEAKAEDVVLAFNDLHAIMTFLGAGRMDLAERTLASMKQAARGVGDNARMTHTIGLPLAEGFIAFEAGRFAEAVDRIASVRSIAQRFGGSHAQRDILSLTALHAAIRGGMRSAAEAIAAERTALKPDSP